MASASAPMAGQSVSAKVRNRAGPSGRRERALPGHSSTGRGVVASIRLEARAISSNGESSRKQRCASRTNDGTSGSGAGSHERGRTPWAGGRVPFGVVRPPLRRCRFATGSHRRA